jgi:ketosteroid isomerase-like protein
MVACVKKHFVARWRDTASAMSRASSVSRDDARAFVEHYGRSWEAWDFSGFAALFSPDVIYVPHATAEAVVGQRALASYVRKEAADQGQASVRMGSPVIDGDRVAAEFWVTRSNEGKDWTTAGCFVARLGSDGRCTFFREYWFDVEGHTDAYDGWGQ